MPVNVFSSGGAGSPAVDVEGDLEPNNWERTGLVVAHLVKCFTAHFLFQYRFCFQWQILYFYAVAVPTS